MNDTQYITPFGCPVPPIFELTPDQAIDALEAVCDALLRAFRADYQYYIAKTSATTIECRVDAFDAWNTAKISISNFAQIKSLSSALAAASDQLSKLLQTRLSHSDDYNLNISVLLDLASSIESEPGNDPRLTDLLTDAANFSLYIRDVGLPMPDVSELLENT